MATTVDDIKTKYPLPVYYYDVKIDDLDPIAFKEVSGLTIGYEDPITYKDGLSHKEGAKHMPGQRSAVDITMKKGIVRGDPKLFDWINTINLNTVVKKDITVSLMDESDSPVVSWKITNAFPKKMEAPTFDATSNDVAIESLELRADSLSIEYQ